MKKPVQFKYSVGQNVEVKNPRTAREEIFTGTIDEMQCKVKKVGSVIKTEKTYLVDVAGFIRRMKVKEADLKKIS